MPSTSSESSWSSETGAAHALSVAVAVVLRSSQVLLVSRREVAGNSDLLWQFPAGMIKPGAASHAVAVAETLAETGVHSIHLRHLGRRLHPATHVFCEYHLCEFVSGQAANLDAAENSGVVWVDTSQLPRLIAPEFIYPPVVEALGLTSWCAAKSG
ncbi:MAG: NUDIX hydrolase, partial [Actinobacteria bacterium]|nr:NUDIX hydrolase [Actinomycetota bacterium]